MRAKIDKEACVSCGLCPSVCPECFEIEGDGKAGVTVNEVPNAFESQAQEAAESCPVNAISIEA